MNRKHLRKRAASPARRRLAVAAAVIVIGGLIWITRTVTGPHSKHPRKEPNAQLVEELVRRVAVFRAEHRSLDALDAARQLTDASPNDPRWWRLLSGLYEEQDDIVYAIDAYRRALQNELPLADELSMRHKLVEQLMFLGDAPAARHEFKQLETRVEDDASLASRRSEQTRLDVERARLLRLEGHPRGALDSLNRALTTLGDAPLAIRLRGIILMDLGEVENATSDLEHAARELPYDEIVHYTLSAAYRRLGRTKDADRHLQRYQQIHDAHLEIQRIKRDADERPMSDEQRQRLAQLYKAVGK